MTTAASTPALDPAAQQSGPRSADVIVVGTALLAIVAGAAVQGPVWLEWLGADRTDELVQGAMLLRLALVAVGIYGLIGWRLQFWRRPAAAAGPALAGHPRTTAGQLDTTAPGFSRSANAGVTNAVPPLLMLLLVAATALRLYKLEGGLWIDEVGTLVSYAREPFGQIFTTYDSQNQHMLYSLLAHASFLVFGEGAWALRLPAALFGVAGVWALYLLGTEVASRRESLLAAAVLTFSYQHIWFSQNARGYTGLLLGALLSTWLLLRALRTGHAPLWLAYALTTALGVFVHQTMLFVVAGQLAVYAAKAGPWQGRSRWLPFWAGFVPAGLLTIALHAIVLPQFPETTAKDVSVVQTWLSPLWTLRELVLGLHLGPLMVVGAVAGLFVVLLGVYGFWRHDAAIPLMLFVPAASGAAAMAAFSHPIWPRFFFFAAGFAILVLVRGLSEAAALAAKPLRWTPERMNTAASLATMVVIAAGLPSFRYVYAPKQDFAGARDFVNSARTADDAVVTVGVATGPFSRYYEPSWHPAASAGEVAAIGAGKARTWLVYTLPTEMASEHPDIQNLVARDFTAVREFGGTLNGGTIYVYRADHLTGR